MNHCKINYIEFIWIFYIFYTYIDEHWFGKGNFISVIGTNNLLIKISIGGENKSGNIDTKIGNIENKNGKIKNKSGNIENNIENEKIEI